MRASIHWPRLQNHDTPEAASAPVHHAPHLPALLSLGLMVGTINGLSRVAMPLFAAANGAAAWQVGIVGGLGYLGVLLMALPMGAWIDRHGSRAMFLRGVMAAALLYLLLPLLHTPWLVIAGAAVLGFVLPFRTVPIQTEFLAMLPHLGPAKAGWNRGAFMLGLSFIGPAVSAAVLSSLGFTALFLMVTATLVLAFIVGRRVLLRRSGVGGQAGDNSLRARVAAQIALLRHDADVRRTMGIDCLSQMSVAYFVVFAIQMAMQRFGMTLQAAAGLITLQGALYVATLFAGGMLVARWRDDLRYLFAFVMLLAQSALYGCGSGAWALWPGAALMGVGVGLQGVTSTARFGELMRKLGRGRIGGLTSLAPTTGGIVGAVLGGVLSQHLGIEAGFMVLAVAHAVMCALHLQRLRAARHSANDHRGGASG
ncbi:MAG TPA: MFS transporter [Burkholderiaceae bacterium]|nr:MFS transporter [Burkholderiaceae bacterium]